MARMEILFDGFVRLAQEVDRVTGQLEKAVDDALNETSDIIQTETRSASSIYATKGGGRQGYATGAMYRSIVSENQVKWKGYTAEVNVGFDFGKHGGHHSIFIMYGTPKIPKDAKVYNAIRGTRTRKRVYEAQEKKMREYLSIGGGTK